MPLTYDEALMAAKAFLNANPFPYPEYRYVPTTGRAIADGWYFDFWVERIDGQPLEGAFGGAPGSRFRPPMAKCESLAGRNSIG